MGFKRDRGHGHEFFRQGTKLFENYGFQVMCMSFVVKNWHLNYTETELKVIFSELETLIACRPKSIDYKRVYIPKRKDSEELRPLGVPTIP